MCAFPTSNAKPIEIPSSAYSFIPPEKAESMLKAIEVFQAINAQGPIQNMADYKVRLAEHLQMSKAEHLLRETSIQRYAEKMQPSTLEETFHCLNQGQKNALIERMILVLYVKPPEKN